MSQDAYFTTGIGAAFGKIVSGTTTVTTSGTAVQLTVTSIPIPGIFLSGDIGNTGTIVVGDANVSGVSGSQQGIALEPAGNSIFVQVNNQNLLFVDSEVNGDKLIWAYLQPSTA